MTDLMSGAPEYFDRYAPQMRRDLLGLRDLILSTASATGGVGQIEEGLKWRQPAFWTVKPKSGSTMRIDAVDESRYALYFICHTHLVAHFRELYPDEFKFEGDRALLFELGEALPLDALRHCIALALTYHLK